MNRVSRTSFSAGLVALLLLLVNPALAQSEAGRILFSRGVVSIVGAEDSARGGKTGDVIYEGERVETGRNGIAQLRLSDGALIALRASSNYHIQRQGYDVQGNVYEQTGQLVAGWMRMVTGAIGTRYPGNVKQGTNVATIGIRGTTFQVIHIPEGGLPGYPDTAPGTYLMLEEGSIEVTTDGGKRLLQPGDVIFVSSKDAPPQLAPDKKGLFLNVPDGDASYVDLEESDFADFTNETVLNTLLPTRAFDAGAAVGFATVFNQFSDRYYALQDPFPSYTTSGSGAGRIMTSVTFNPEASDYLMEAVEGKGPESTGYRVLRDGSEINWGVWDSAHYTASVFNPDTGVFDSIGNAGRDWHYMMASNVMDPSKVVSSLTGEATFNWVGGTNFMVNGVTTSNQITGGSVLVNFLTQNMNFDLATNFTTNNLNNSDCSSAGCSIFDFYNGGISIGDQAGFSGSIGGAFVGDGTGIISYIEVWDDGSNDVYHGTAAFSGNPEPFVGEPNPGP
jgi:hypothetical protein